MVVQRSLTKEGNGSFNGQNFVLESKAIKSALDLIPDILNVYDLIYRNFPNAYNKAGGGFGRIEGVRIFDPTITNNPKYSKKPFKTKYFDKECKFQYADGFIIPIVVGLLELMEYDEASNSVEFSTDPVVFVEEFLEHVLIRYSTIVKFANYDPQKIAKDRGTYQMAADAIKSALIT